MKICLVCSPGGHLVQIKRLEKFYAKYDYFFVSFLSEPLKELICKEKFYFVKDPGRKVIPFLHNIFQSLKIFLAEKPDVVISTGAGVAIAMCWWARFFAKKVIFIEDWCVIDKPSFSGKLAYPIANLFIVQWQPLLKYYPKAVFRGSLI